MNNKYIIYFFIFFLLHSAKPSWSQEQNVPSEDEINIIWNKNNKLSFNDFKINYNIDSNESRKADSIAFVFEHQNRELYYNEYRKYIHDSASDFFLYYINNSKDSYSEISIYKSFSIEKNIIYYNVYAYFNRYGSHLEKNDTNYLNHEQIHFDICEFFARKIRAYLCDSVSISTSTAVIDAFIKQCELERDEMDLAFDKDASSDIEGRPSAANLKWRKNIHAYITKFSKYEIIENRAELK